VADEVVTQAQLEAEGLFAFRFGLKGAGWVVRSSGGVHDPAPVIAHAATLGEAFRTAKALRRFPALE